MFFPFYLTMMLAVESTNVVGLRMMKLASGGSEARDEAKLMLSEKIDAMFEASASLTNLRQVDQRNRSGSDDVGLGGRSNTDVAIHKPSALVSFGLPESLSFRVREHAIVDADRGQTSTGKASGSGLKGLTRQLRECNVCKGYATKGETQEIKDEPAAGLCSIDDIDGHTKPDQYGRHICRLRHDPARTFSRQAFLRRPTVG